MRLSKWARTHRVREVFPHKGKRVMTGIPVPYDPTQLFTLEDYYVVSSSIGNGKILCVLVKARPEDIDLARRIGAIPS